MLRDRFRIPRPGETEIKVEDGLGITIDHARIGSATTSDGANHFRFVGPGGPLADDGLDLAFTASERAPLTTGAACAGAAAAGGRRVPTGLLVGAAAALAFVLAAIVVLVQRRRRRR